MAARIMPAGRAETAVQAAVRAELGNRRGIGVGAFVLALVTAGAMAHVGVRMKGIEVAYELGHERRINTQLEEERRRLNIEIGMLKDPVRVVSIARDKLKMGPPAQADIVRLTPGQILGVHPEPAPALDKRAARADQAAAAKSAKPRPAPTRTAPAAAARIRTAPAEAAPTRTEAAPAEAPAGDPPPAAEQAAPGREGDE